MAALGEAFVRLRQGVRFRGSGFSFDSFNNSGSRLFRIGDKLYAYGTDIELQSFVDTPDFESFDDITHFGEEPTAEILEEIPLDELELDTSVLSETAPLLDSGVAGLSTVSSSGAVASAPGLGAVITGITIGAGTIIVGTTLGTLTSRTNTDGEPHKDPIVSIPDHRYIGPGNDISNALPVDVDDAISKQHDIDYSKAGTQDAIKAADDIAIGGFVDDFVNTGNVHSGIGALGLGVKRGLESVVGVQYPPNLPASLPGELCLANMSVIGVR